MNCKNFRYLNIYNYGFEKLQLNQIGLEAFCGTTFQINAENSRSLLTVNGILYRCFCDTEQFEFPETCTSIAADAFAHNSAIREIVIPETVTSIGDGAFYRCDALASVVIPDSVTSIGNGVFVDCTALESVTIGSGVTETGSDLFAGCTALKKVTAPEGSAAAKQFAGRS